MTKATRKERRAANKRVGRRALDRQATALVARILELSDKGLSPAAVASSTGLSEQTVASVLELREPGEAEGEGGTIANG